MPFSSTEQEQSEVQLMQHPSRNLRQNMYHSNRERNQSRIILKLLWSFWIAMNIMMLYGNAVKYDVRLLVAEIRQPQVSFLRDTKKMHDLIDKLREEGHKIVREKDIVFVLPREYFDNLDTSVGILTRMRPFQIAEKDSIPEFLFMKIEKLIKKHQPSFLPEKYDKYSISLSVVAVFDDKSAPYEITVVPPMADASLFVTFFNGTPEEWRRQLSISPMHNLNNHSGSSIDINVPKSERNLQRANEQDDYKIGFTRTVLLYARPVPTIKLSDEERVRYTARYYQLLHRELQNQQAQWIAMWEEVTLSILGQFKDWQNWTGNRWRGHWEELPTDIRQKLALLLQANNAPIDYQKIQCELIIIPYIGFVQDDGNFRYSEWFTLID